MSTNSESQDRFTEILQHRISFFFRGDDAPQQLDEASAEHVENLIKEGFNQGELCYYDSEKDVEYRGWWSIEK